VSRVRGLVDVLHWALMWLLAGGRVVICWAYLISFLSAMGALADQVRQPPTHLYRSMAYLAVLAVTSLAAWWTTLRNRRSYRIWVTGASLIYLLTLVPFIVKQPSIVFSLGPLWGLLLMGGLGLAAFFAPFRIRFSLHVSSYRTKQPDQEHKGALVWLLAACRFLVCWGYCWVSVICLWVTADEIRKSPMHFDQLIAVTSVLTIVFGAAWWTTLRTSRTHKFWVIAVSLVYLLTLAPFVIEKPSPLHPLGEAWVILMIGALGLLAYLLPYRLRYSVDAFSYRLESPDQILKELHASL
jgi:hypothetical protein